MSQHFIIPLQVFITIICIIGAYGTAPPQPVEAASPNVVISEVYGGGGNSGAFYKNDFIELFNLGQTVVDLSTWSVQYTSASGTTWSKTNLTGTIQPGAYYLIQEAVGSGGTLDLPTPDATGAITMSGTNAKVALVSHQTAMTGAGSPTATGVVDFVGYGTANVWEGSGATPALTNTTSASRTIVCLDADDNMGEFTVGPQTPQNSASPASPCSANAIYLTSTPSNGRTGVLINANLVLRFNKAVTPSAGWLSLTCNLSGTHTAAAAVDGTTITLNPDTDFAYSEACTLAINGSLVDANMTYSPTIRFSTAYYGADSCGDPYTPISELQGSGNATPFAGLQMATEGVVTADLQSTKKGFYIQSLSKDVDSDPLTSEGMFIYVGDSIYTVPLGAWVRVTGTITEFSGLTEMTNPFPRMHNCGASGETISPVELSLPFADFDYPERYENMLVSFPQALIISEYFNFDRYGEIVLTSERHMTPTAMVEPGLPAQAAAAAYMLDRITLDDGRTDQNPDPAIHPNGLAFDMSNLFRGGGTMTNVTGVMDYGFSLYRIQPTVIGATYIDINPRTAAPEIIEGDLKVASFNVLNFFVTLTSQGSICGPLGGQDCRGADDAREFDRQKFKILSALIAIDADIFGLMEIENEHIGGGNAVADLVDGLNTIAGAGTYDYIFTGAIGGDAIKQAILYKPVSVTPIGAFQLLTTTVDARFIDTRNRPALAQVFKDNKTGTHFAVAVNHLKSKGSDCVGDLGLPDDPDLFDGAGNCNLTRKAAAQALVDWLANPIYFPGVQKTLIIGDLNSYDKEDPIDMIKLGTDDIAGTADDYLDMILEKRDENAYGYVFDGQIGYLDHALANQSLAQDIVDVNFWHINADEPDLIDYDTSFKDPAQDDLYASDAYRSSDHDPVIVTFTLKAVLYLPLISK